MAPLVSIIIPFYNCSFIDQALNSALKQTYTNCEIILIDDGSTAYVDKIAPFLNQITYVRKENGGTVTALNKGIRHAKGDYFVWLSSDDLFLPNKVSEQIKFMLDNQLDISFTNYDIIDENNLTKVSWACPRFTNVKDIYIAYLTFNAINGCTIMMKTELFNKIGLFKMKYRYTHDYEMWMRVLTKRLKIDYLDQSLTEFRQHSQSGTSKHQDEMLKEMKIIEHYYRRKIAKILNQL